MANRKQTPDVLGEMLGGGSAAPEPPPAPAPGPQKRQPAGPRRRRSKSARAKWEYLEVVFYDYGGYRPRLVNGQEQTGWKKAPPIHEYLNQLGQEGWELAAVGSRHKNFMPIYFKRPQR